MGSSILLKQELDFLFLVSLMGKGGHLGEHKGERLQGPRKLEKPSPKAMTSPGRTSTGINGRIRALHGIQQSESALLTRGTC
jgi:hypothetical protein